MHGRWFCSATSCARRCFFTVSGKYVPPFTVASFATITHSRPSTTPIPVTIPADGACPSYSSHAARAFSSRNAVPGSTSRSMRSRAGSLPRERCRSTDASPPPAATSAVRSRSSATSASMPPPGARTCRRVRHWCRARSCGLQRDEDGTRRDSVADADVDRPDARVVGRGHDLLHLHRLEHDERLVRRRASPSATRTSITVPGIGAVTRPSAASVCRYARPPRPGAAPAPRRSGRLSRQLPPQPCGTGRGEAESGGNCSRNPVESSARRNAGCATSQRRNGRFVVTPSTTVSSRASASRSSAASRSARVCDELRDHRVVARAHLVALGDARVDADGLRQREPRDASGLREERPRILGVEPRFDRVALRAGLEPREPLAVRDAELQLDEIEPGHRLGHGVLDLDPGVQLQEEDLARRRRGTPPVPALS